MVLSLDASSLDLLLVKHIVVSAEEPLSNSVNNGLKKLLTQVNINFIKPKLALAAIDYALIKYFNKTKSDASKLNAYHVLEDLSEDIKFGAITSISNLKVYLNNKFTHVLKQQNKAKTFKHYLKD